MEPFEKRVALVTGANRGIGREIAERLAGKGLRVLLGARDGEAGRAEAARLREKDLDVHPVVVDVAEARSVQVAVANIRDRWRRLDVLVNNAGILIDPETSALSLDATTLTNTLRTNSFAPLLLAQACIPLMKGNGYGRIVNVSSALGSLTDIARPDSPHAAVQAPAYRMSKALLNAVTVLMAKDLAGTNILVNSACPGWVRTDLGGPQAPRSAAEGADTPVWLATLPDDGPTGGFFRDRQPIPW